MICAFNWQNMPSASYESTKINLYWAYISLNVGQGDPLFGMKLKAFHIINNYQVRTICAFY